MRCAIPPHTNLPTHLDLPEKDGQHKRSFLEVPQAIVLTDSILPVLHTLHPDDQFAIAQDSGIYWRVTDPPLRGCVAPDWFYVPGVPPMLEGQYRRSYVLWQELIPPLIVIEFASGDGTEERDTTPEEGKFWIYERRIRPGYYVIWLGEEERLEVYRLQGCSFQPMPANERGHFPIPEIGVELGLHPGIYAGQRAAWTRWFDDIGNLLPTGWERCEILRQRLEESQRQTEEARRQSKAHRREKTSQQRAERLAARMRELGINPDEV